MKQFFSTKWRHPDALLPFRCGDFYETYGGDAIEGPCILGIALTERDNEGNNDETAMAGFLHHTLDTYLPRLIRAGKRVAICDQLESPKEKQEELKDKKGLSTTDKMMKRGITELMTPSVAIGDNMLNYKENNLLAAVRFGKAACGVNFLDISTGEFLTGESTYDYMKKLLDSFAPKEVLYNHSNKRNFDTHPSTKYCIFELEDWMLTE